MEIFIILLASFINIHHPKPNTPKAFEKQGYHILDSEYDPAGYLIEAISPTGDTVNITTFTYDNYSIITKA